MILRGEHSAHLFVQPVAGQDSGGTDHVIITGGGGTQEIRVSHRNRRGPAQTRTVRQPALMQLRFGGNRLVRTGGPVHLRLSGISTRRESRERTRIITQVEGVLIQVEGEQVLVEGSVTEGTHEGQVQDLVPGFATGCPEGGGPGTGGLYDGFTGGHGANRQQTLRAGAVQSIALRVGGGEQVMPRVRGGGSLQTAGTGGVVHRAVALTGADLQTGTCGNGFVEPAGAPLQGAVGIFAGQNALLCSVFCVFGVLQQLHAQTGCQRGGQGASGAVRITAVQARGAHVRAGAVREDRGVTGVLTAQVAALHDHGSSGRRRKVRRLLVRLIESLGGLLLTEHGELRNVRGNHIHERHEVA